jgi:hypothetical protein
MGLSIPLVSLHAATAAEMVCVVLLVAAANCDLCAHMVASVTAQRGMQQASSAANPCST